MNIIVTGMGIVSAIGNSLEEVLDSLLKEKSGISKMRYLSSVHRNLPVGEVKLSDDQLKEAVGVDKERIVSRTALLGAYAINQAVEDAGIIASDYDRIAIINGTTVGGMDLTERYFSDMKTDDSLLCVLDHHDCGSTSDEIAEICGISAEVCTISTACSSALNAVMIGAEMLKNNEADIVIAGGTEALSLFHLNGFHSLMILDEEQCRPFDKTRAGINLGEGAAYLVLQRETDLKDGAPKAFISGYANACDAFHQIAYSDDGIGASMAMSGALEMAWLNAEDIQYINAHGTGTQNNDLSEGTAIKKVFGEKIPCVSSTKAFTGHTTSASGSLELVMCLLAMRHNFVPSNLGWNNPMDNGLTPSVGNVSCMINNVMCNSFGFGGNDSSLILSKNACGQGQAVASFEFEQVSEVEITEIEQLKDCKEVISPMESRRMGKLMKAATLTSLRALRAAGIDKPDAIITATAYGMIENTEKFLQDMVDNGETLLKPTLFMQSTHNTIGSNIAIRLGCHGYNVTYSQGKNSWEWALRDAERLIRTGKAKNVLVGCHDESTPLVCEFLKRAHKTIPHMIYSKSVVLRRKERQ